MLLKLPVRPGPRALRIAATVAAFGLILGITAFPSGRMQAPAGAEIASVQPLDGVAD